mmetsp:Transcript_30179/g.97311  ORF Transcript_30179/g.97311 Transcript_30179/m.97311 type:complete len:235 (+) Transcript_30179:266-970(+)
MEPRRRDVARGHAIGGAPPLGARRRRLRRCPRRLSPPRPPRLLPGKNPQLPRPRRPRRRSLLRLRLQAVPLFERRVRARRPRPRRRRLRSLDPRKASPLAALGPAPRRLLGPPCGAVPEGGKRKSLPRHSGGRRPEGPLRGSRPVDEQQRILEWTEPVLLPRRVLQTRRVLPPPHDPILRPPRQRPQRRLGVPPSDLRPSLPLRGSHRPPRRHRRRPPGFALRPLGPTGGRSGE